MTTVAPGPATTTFPPTLRPIAAPPSPAAAPPVVATAPEPLCDMPLASSRRFCSSAAQTTRSCPQSAWACIPGIVSKRRVACWHCCCQRLVQVGQEGVQLRASRPPLVAGRMVYRQLSLYGPPIAADELPDLRVTEALLRQHMKVHPVLCVEHGETSSPSAPRDAGIRESIHRSPDFCCVGRTGPTFLLFLCTMCLPYH